LAIIHILLGVLLVIAAIGVMVLAGYLGLVTIPTEIQQSVPQWFVNLAPLLLAIAGIVILVFGLVSIAIGWGFLKGKNWSRVLAMIFFVIVIIVDVFNAIVAAIFTSGALLSLIVAIIIPVIIVWYLTTSRVKAWFKPEYYVRQP
jgi:hypothetical protein